MSETMTPTTQERRREAAESYRASLIVAGGSGRATSERQQAGEFEDAARGLRSDARQDAETASRARQRLSP